MPLVQAFALLCAGLPIGLGALLALIGDRLQRPRYERHERIGNRSRDPGPSLSTKHCGLGRFGRSFGGGQSVDGRGDCECHGEGKGDF